ncbi:uncharacterized protein LOC130760060 isoform X2 [Actinidia eriantha]|uniref:uncharacterized protein LOC130760060 isoform X2 n=1 Tax=Actinidia eriantha TaxID=165200 RepID=UPI00258CA7AB|nr:uncharacterized protein LOC130760060 isoform X2 [Actinidia eriantha]
MEDLKSAMGDHVDQMANLVEKLTAELRSGLRPAYDNFVGFFHAIDWTEPWLICFMLFHVVFLLIAIMSRKHINFQMCLFLLAWQNYFDPRGLFLSVLWSGPLLVIAILILVNTLFSLCHLIVRWKRAELRHRARLHITRTIDLKPIIKSRTHFGFFVMDFFFFVPGIVFIVTLVSSD